MKSGRPLVLPGLILQAFLAVNLLGQANVNEEQGLKPYDSWHGGDLDTVSLTNGGLVLHIPLVSFPQRGNLPLTFSIYSNTKNWQELNYCIPDPPNPMNCSNTRWEPLPRGGLFPVTPNGQVANPNYSVDGAYVASSLDYWFQSFSQAEPIDPNNPPNQTYYDWLQAIVSPDGNAHVLASFSGGTTSGPAYPLRSFDTTGILFDGTNLMVPNGTRFSFSNGRTPQANNTAASAITDANGNLITVSNSNGSFTDTLGRVIPAPPGTSTSDLSNCPAGAASARVWNVPGPNGGTRTFKFCYSNVTVYTNFSLGDSSSEYPSTTTPLLSAVVLPDLTSWTFAYDNYSDITRLGFPTGGSITYTYAIAPFSNTLTGGSMVVTSRTVDANDGTGGHKWSYKISGQYIGNPSVWSGTIVVTSPDGNDTVHTIGSPVSNYYATVYDLQVQYYQGSQGSGTPLKTVATQYGGAGNASVGVCCIVPTQVSTIWEDGHTSKVVNTWDSGTTENPYGTNSIPLILGSLLRTDEYDYSNALVRSTINQYLWQANSTYFNNNFLSLVSSTTTTNGAGTQVEQITYGYDEVAVTPSNLNTSTLVSPPAGGNIRGNRTTTSHWLDRSNSSLSSTATYFDSGMVASSTPPQNSDGLNRTTNYSYSSNFVGAYLTQTNMPDTQMPDSGAPVVHHVISGNYDFNTGLLTSFTDENSQVYSYQYDNMLRLTQGNHPDQGQTIFTYPDPNTVTRQRLISGNTYDSFSAKFDGLGRSYETLQAVPGATVEVDTTFDSVGRVATVSNPYYQGSSHSSDPTYGVTQTQYDALNRVIKTIKQDNSTSAVKYNDAAGDGAGSAVVCTSATDEAGKQRQVCNDGLGRMVKVIEPNPGAPATNGTGWITVSGTEQTANSQPGTSGSATITISGTEQSACTAFRSGRCLGTIWDTGTVTVTVGGFPAKSVSYGHFDTPATIAWNLSCAFHNDTSSAADAYCPGSAGTSTQVVLTARITGTASNYSFTTSSVTSDTTCTYFCGPSFTAAPASGGFAGGQNASSTPDTGTVTATINGTPYSVNYGAADSSTTIAQNLASAISAGTLANAAASGGTVNLTSKTPGTPGDYSLSASYTWNSGQFTNPSFTTSTSGSISGGKDAAGLNNNPFVTTYQYNARGDMLCVHQKGTDTSSEVACTGTTPPSVPASWRQRFFAYDSLSRLLTAMNPETNSTGNAQITYAYDADSNVTSKIEPAPNQAWGSSATVTINYTYDALNRLLNTTYSDGVTPSTAHRYDYSGYLGQSFTYPIGREVAATSSNGVQYFTSYEQMGRVAQTVECVPGVSTCQTFKAFYDKLGDLTTLNYPGNGFTVTYGYDSAARLTTATDSNGVSYAQSPTFLASGAMQEFTSPNFNNNKYHVDYNSRLQPTEIWTGSAEGAGALFDKQYQYNAPNTSQMNNGNIYSVTNVKDSTRTQTFTYDPLNRLTSAGDQTHWYNSCTYDAWGNLTQKTKGTLPYGESLSTSATANNQLLGYSYDAAGNMLTDGINGWTYVYDAENRITTAGSVTYTYDADGRRVKKSSGTNYWYGPTGVVLSETDSSGNWTNYIFFGGQRLARNVSGDIKYYITDHLHSTAVFADKSGSILDDNDFYPWGGLIPGVGQTTNNNTIKFTGQYRDSESNLDYFGARYYENATGRFMSPDWAAKPTNVPYAEFGDPQSLNLYSYVRNSPIVRVDTNGHFNDPFNTFGGGGFLSNIQSRWGVSLDITVKTTFTVNTYADGHQDITNVHSEVTDISLSTGPPTGPNGKNSFTKRHLSEYENKKLSPYLSKATRDDAILHIGKVPFWLRHDADAVTLHNDIYFRNGVYDPGTFEGLALLAHELFHVDQYARGWMTVKSYLLEAMKHGGDEENKYEAPAYRFQNAVLQHLTSSGTYWDGSLIP